MPSPTTVDATVDERLWNKIDTDFEDWDKCWEWEAGQVRPGGYGMFCFEKKMRAAHRVVYEVLVGKVPDGLELDHLCRNPPCVNPNHLEPVTRAENQRRGFGASGINARKTKCKHGHSYEPGNTVLNSYGWRMCAICIRRWERNSAQQKLDRQQG